MSYDLGALNCSYRPTFIMSGDQESSRTDLTLEILMPRWMPAQLIHRNTPKFTEAQSGSVAVYKSSVKYFQLS